MKVCWRKLCLHSESVRRTRLVSNKGVFHVKPVLSAFDFKCRCSNRLCGWHSQHIMVFFFAGMIKDPRCPYIPQATSYGTAWSYFQNNISKIFSYAS